jgi:dTMP kinase
MKSDDIHSGSPGEEAPVRKEPLLIPGGLFIVFEGIDGTGKSTQVRLLAEKLKKLGYAVVATREPTDGPYGQKIRELFLDRNTVSQDEELELFMADRAQHVEQVIAPALSDGRIVISDRYYLSTVAYQGANGMDPEMIQQKNAEFPVPDLAIILEIEPARGIDRIQNNRNEHPNTFEEEANLRKVAKIFADLPQSFIKRINGSGSIEDVQRQVFEKVDYLLTQKKLQHMEC